ncbi:MAG: hypothetical protein AB1778_08590 [Candidatus Bipolaricaulota bacterium]
MTKLLLSLLSLLSALLLLLANEPAPYITTDRSAFPYSFSDTSKPVYPQTLDGARRFIADCRELWAYKHNVGGRYPRDSYGAMHGDCDDWAAMVACYLQEHFGYDTFIIIFKLDGVTHACPFVAGSSGLVRTSDCPGLPTATLSGAEDVYYAVERDDCPRWHWIQPTGSLGTPFEWTDIAGDRHI